MNRIPATCPRCKKKYMKAVTAKPLTPRRLAALDFIVAFTAQHRYAPTIQEIASGLGITKSTAFQHIEELRAAGYIDFDRRHRSIRVLKHAGM